MKKNQKLRVETFTVCHVKSRLLSDKPHSSGKVGNGHPLGFRMPVAIVLGLPDGLTEFPALLRTGFADASVLFRLPQGTVGKFAFQFRFVQIVGGLGQFQ